MAQQPNASRSPKLIVFGGLPGVGKTVIARVFALEIEAVYLRIDSIEQVLRDSAAVAQPINDAGYRVAYVLAGDNLRMGRTVVVDCVNPILVTREAWREIARRACAQIFEVEVRCSDVEEHRRRVESRTSDIPGLTLPTWNEVLAREYQPWDRDHIEVDAMSDSVDQIVATIRRIVTGGHRSPEYRL